jgi:hypothetical protein
MVDIVWIRANFICGFRVEKLNKIVRLQTQTYSKETHQDDNLY